MVELNKRVKVSRTLLSALTNNVGAPQGSALLFTLYTDDCCTGECLSECHSNTSDQCFLKYWDDTALIALSDNSGDPRLHQRMVNKVVEQ